MGAVIVVSGMILCGYIATLLFMFIVSRSKNKEGKKNEKVE